MEITEVRIKRKEDGGKVLAMASVTFDEVLVCRTFRILDGQDGPWVGFPAFKGGDKWVDIVFPLNKELRDEIKSRVLSAYVADGGEPSGDSDGGSQEALPAVDSEARDDNLTPTKREEGKGIIEENPDLGVNEEDDLPF